MTEQAGTLVRRLMEQPWGLWWLQAFVPTVIILIHLLIERHPQFAINEDTTILAGIMQFYYIRLGIFFGCLGIFSRLIRGEMIERSLHFYMLAPVRREVLLLAKFAAGAISALALFGTATIANFAFIYLGFGAAGQDYMFNGAGMGQLEAYLVIVVLACLGYGSVFLLLSMMFRNPTPAALLVFGWEAVNPVMPSLLQKISVASYLRHLMPVTVQGQDIFALLTVTTEPVPGWVAALGLLVLIAVVLTYSCYRMRTLEIRYTTE